MTAQVVQRHGGNWVLVTCDACGVEAPPAAEILAGHGLNNMGWACSGGTHICPECKNKPEEQDA